MKTLKFVMFLIAFGLFGGAYLMAQPEGKDFDSVTEDVSIYPVFCGTERATGTRTREWKIIVPGQVLQRKIFFSMIGEDSGCHYEGRLLQNVHYQNPPSGAITRNYQSLFLMKKDGVAIGMIHYTWHVTVNANGEVTVYDTNYFEECFESR